MTKDQIAEAVAAKCDLTKKQSEEFVDAMLEAITNALQKGEKVVFTGFGAFQVNKRAARQGINPKTLEKIQIAAMNVPKFKAGKSLKEAVR